jgi:hypothetical protein
VDDPVAKQPDIVGRDGGDRRGVTHRGPDHRRPGDAIVVPHRCGRLEPPDVLRARSADGVQGAVGRR